MIDILENDLVKSNIYYGNEVIKNLNDYIIANFKYQKVLFFCSVDNYENVKSNFCCADYEIIVLAMECFDIGELDKIAEGIKCEVRLLVGIGDFELVQAVKYIASIKDMPFVLIKKELPLVEEMLDVSILYDGVYVDNISKKPERIFLDSDAICMATRRNISECVYSMINKIGYFEDYYLRYLIHKEDFNCKDFALFKDIYNKLYNILDKVAMLESEALLRLGDLVLCLGVLLHRLGYSVREDKLYVFSNLYLLFTGKSYNGYEYALSGQIGLQATNKVYEKFIKKIGNMNFEYIDVVRRVEMFDKCFRNFKIDYNAYEMPNVERLQFILKRNQAILNQKVNVLSQISVKLLNKSFLVLEDSGYNISRGTDAYAVVKAVTYCSDVVCGNSFIKIVRDFGALEMYE